jgi:hypothetical protein
MSLDLKKGRVLILAATVVVVAGVGFRFAPPAQSAARGQCAAASASTAARSPRRKTGPKPMLRGAVRMRAARSGWNVQAASSPTASYVSQSFRTSRTVRVKFCLRASPGAATELVRLQPSGISLMLRGHHLTLEVAHRGRNYRASHPASIGGSGSLVDLAVDGTPGRVDLYVGGRRQGSFVGKTPASSVVQVGSLVPRAAGSVRLTGVNVTTCDGSVVPAGEKTSSGSCATAADAVTSAAWPGNPFSPSSFWNAPLADNTPLSSRSHAYVDELVRQVDAYGAWMDTTSYSVPVYVVAANQATQHVTLDTWGPDLQAAFDAVPIPANAQAAAGSDEHMVVWQPSTNKMWEFWQMHQESDGWHAQWGGEMNNVSTNPGYFTHHGQTDNWGATATGLPLLGGLVTEADLERGYINHALAISLVETERGYWSWPAQRTDGDTFTPGITPIPEGTRFRLNPNLNIASLHLPTLDRMLAQAAQTYGIVVRDKAGAVSFYGQDPVNLSSNPWPQVFDNDSPATYLSWFPWNQLQALRSTQSCCWSH